MSRPPFLYALIFFTLFQGYLAAEHGFSFDVETIVIVWVVVLAFESEANRIDNQKKL